MQALLAEVDPGWWEHGAEPGPDADLLRRARGSALGCRLLAGWLAADAGAAILAPAPGRDPWAMPAKWPRERLAPLTRDVGILAFAPAIRAEVRREPVRCLKRILGTSYLLALDRSVWDGVLAAGIASDLATQLSDALAATDADSALVAMFGRQGRAELQAWARRRDPALADWVALTHPRETPADAHLPEKALLRVYTHHETRGPVA